MLTTVNEWQAHFSRVYGGRNAERPEFEIFTRLQEHLGMLSKVSTLRSGAARLQNLTAGPTAKGTAQYFMARGVAWYFALANKCGTNVVDAVWAKYPGICPYCRQALCRCHELDDLPPFEPDYVRQVAASNRPTFAPEGYSLDRWQQHFSKIYRINRKFPVEQIFLHLFEELSEVAEAIRLPNRAYINDELGDIFAWLMAVFSGLKVAQGGLQAALVAQYGTRCPGCGRLPCACEIRSADRRAAGRRVPEVAAADIASIDEAFRRPEPISAPTTALVDEIYRSEYNKNLSEERLDGQIAKSTESGALFAKAAMAQAEGVRELPGGYDRRVAVLGEFNVYHDLKIIAKAVADLGYIGVTSLHIFEKVPETGGIRITPFVPYSSMSMLEFLNRFIMNCKYVVNLFTHDAGNLIESDWCFRNRKLTLGICFSRTLRLDPCCKFYRLEEGGIGRCTYQGEEKAMYCVTQTCPFTMHNMSKMVLDHYVGRESTKLVILDDWDSINTVLPRFLSGQEEGPA